jgi:hypothetical protein
MTEFRDGRRVRWVCGQGWPSAVNFDALEAVIVHENGPLAPVAWVKTRDGVMYNLSALEGVGFYEEDQS